MRPSRRIVAVHSPEFMPSLSGCDRPLCIYRDAAPCETWLRADIPGGGRERKEATRFEHLAIYLQALVKPQKTSPIETGRRRD